MYVSYDFLLIVYVLGSVVLLLLLFFLASILTSYNISRAQLSAWPYTPNYNNVVMLKRKKNEKKAK